MTDQILDKAQQAIPIVTSTSRRRRANDKCGIHRDWADTTCLVKQVKLEVKFVV